MMKSSIGDINLAVFAILLAGNVIRHFARTGMEKTKKTTWNMSESENKEVASQMIAKRALSEPPIQSGNACLKIFPLV